MSPSQGRLSFCVKSSLLPHPCSLFAHPLSVFMGKILWSKSYSFIVIWWCLLSLLTFPIKIPTPGDLQFLASSFTIFFFKEHHKVMEYVHILVEKREGLAEVEISNGKSSSETIAVPTYLRKPGWVRGRTGDAHLRGRGLPEPMQRVRLRLRTC